MTHPIESLCPGCFADKGHSNPCPHCDYDEQAGRGPLPLPHHTLLHGQYVVGRVLGKPGGFGITYLGWDQHLQTRVAIKEYLPRELAGRSSDRASVAVHSQDEGEQFRYGLEQFVREARTLAQLDHPNIVRVRQLFEANGTAYLVMDYYQGLSLAEYVDQQGGRLTEDQARQLMLPVLDGLRAVHAKNILHRDIKPQNLYLARLESGGVRPILLDFGAARQAMGEHSRSLSVVLTPGYAPFEQYHRRGKQGPWTDIYAAAAVLYRLVTGETPPEATERIAQDDLRPANDFGVSRRLSDALATALAIAPEARYPTVQAFQSALAEAATASSPRVTPPTWPQPASSHPSKPVLTSQRGRAATVSVGTGIPEMAPLPAGRFLMGSSDIQVLCEALAVAPESRPQSVPAFQGRLRGSAPPVSPAPPPPPPTDPVRPPDPKPDPGWWLIAVLGLSLVVLLGVGIWWLGQTRDVSLPPPPPVAAVAPRGYLQVSVSGAAAEVTVDGKPMGRASPGAPLNIERGLPVGEVEVGARAAGYEAQHQRARILENTWTQVQLQLVAEPPARLDFEPELVAITGGCFQMGSPPSEAERDEDERQHRVCVDDFAIGKYEVTQAQWKAVMGDNPSYHSGCDSCPVEMVSWNDVQDYLDKLNAHTGKRYRLPTEAEWEYGARAGTTTAFWSGDCIDTDQANYDGNYDHADCGAKTSRRKTLPVGRLQSNPWGLYDVAGNVWEWTCSAYDADYGGAEQRCAGKTDVGSRALRGGSWSHGPHRVRSAYRNRLTPDLRYGDIGFRLAQDSL